MGICVAVIGAGGKTTAVKLLGKQRKEGSVLLTTTTHIYPILPPEVRICLRDPALEDLEKELSRPGVICAGSSTGRGKLGTLPEEVLQRGIAAAGLTVYEGDGANHRPLKLHNSREPVLLPETCRCLVVAGLSALGKPVSQVIHRYERENQWQKNPQTLVAEKEALRCILETAAASGLSKTKIKIFLNQVDTLTDPSSAVRLSEALQARGLDARWGSLNAGQPGLLGWLLQEPDAFDGSLG